MPLAFPYIFITFVVTASYIRSRFAFLHFKYTFVATTFYDIKKLYYFRPSRTQIYINMMICRFIVNLSRTRKIIYLVTICHVITNKTLAKREGF